MWTATKPSSNGADHAPIDAASVGFAIVTDTGAEVVDVAARVAGHGRDAVRGPVGERPGVPEGLYSGAVVSGAPRLAPSTRNSTDAMPPASLAFAVTVNVPPTGARRRRGQG